MTGRPSPAVLRAPSREEVVEAIRQRIDRADLAPGQRLVESELCELLGASRGTVRNALVDLSHEGLVERIANRGARVRVVGIEEALHIAEARLALETLCVARAAERITDDEIAAFRALGERMRVAAATNDTTGYAALTHEAFLTYIRIARQPVAEELLLRLRARNVRHRFRLTFRPDRAQTGLPFWLAIIDAICSRDPAAAQEAVRAQSVNIQAKMRSLAEAHPPFAVLYPAGDADS